MANTTITGPAGFRVAAVAAGIKQSGDLDLGLVVADEPCSAAAMFTSNKVVGPSVTVSREHVRSGQAQAIYVNAGNANTCTGRRGQRDVESICGQVGSLLGVASDDVLVCSTGVIGHFLPMDKVRRGIGQAAEALSRSSRAGLDFSRAIMTTDTRVKRAQCQVRLDGKQVTLAGVVKGSGMIAPNMATMLAFMTTDADISSAMLRRALKHAVIASFNKVSVDNHVSTSDTAIVLASGRAGNRRISQGGRAYDGFAQGLAAVCDDLARQMAADGEGARCAVTVRVAGAASRRDARQAVRAIVDSPLVRCAFHGADPNWGRIVSAVGYSGARVNLEKLSCRIAGSSVFRNGRPSRFNAVALSKKMMGKQWTVVVDLGAGRFEDFCYTCNMSGDYVRINADYHT